LPQVMAAAPKAALVCDEKCRTALSQHYDTSAWRFQIVGSGDTLSLGKRTFQFLETPMVHWPESMFTYVPEERLLFSMDAFGQHYASAVRFDDQSPSDLVLDEARTYYANIVMPYGGAVRPCLEKAAALRIDMIAPSHGVIWRRDHAKIVEAYHRWSEGGCQPRVLVIYDTMWGSTEQMAKEILHGAADAGADAELIHLRSASLTRIAAEVLEAGGVALGCSTLNRGMLPSAAAAVHYLSGLRPKPKAGLAFGSHGWGPGGPEAIEAAMRELRWELVREPIRARYRPSPELLTQCRQAGAELAAAAIRRAAASC
jgi:flavorubredoxin